MPEWNNFFVATAGASAALTGLIFVGISINIKEILTHQSLPTRASLALTLLMTILISSIILLTVPTIQMAGVITLLTGISLWLILTIKDVSIYRKTEKQYKKLFIINALVDQLASIPYTIAGLLLITNHEMGYYFIVTAYVVSFSKSVSDAWVLIIEILR